VKTNASRLLDKLGLPYRLVEYHVDPDDLSAIKVATEIGLPPEQVFKTLVAKGDLTGVLLAVIPGNQELDLKALARTSGNRRVELAPLDQLQQLTGYIRGGVTALACKKEYPVYLDMSAQQFEVISVSAGVRGTQIFIAPNHYLQATSATAGSFSRSAPESRPHDRR
jgi:Cys-tRNA(Pro)/Cys-tRNA(Cys) deacylase